MYLILHPDTMNLLYKVQSQSVACDLACLRDDINQHIFEVSHPADLLLYTQFELNMLYENLCGESLNSKVTHHANAESVFNLLRTITPDVINAYFSEKQANYAMIHNGVYVYDDYKSQPKALKDIEIVSKFKVKPITQVSTASYSVSTATAKRKTNHIETVYPAPTEKQRTVLPVQPTSWPKVGTASHTIWAACEDNWSELAQPVNLNNLKKCKSGVRDQLLAQSINDSTISVQSNKWVKFKLSEIN